MTTKERELSEQEVETLYRCRPGVTVQGESSDWGAVRILLDEEYIAAEPLRSSAGVVLEDRFTATHKGMDYLLRAGRIDG